MVSWNKGDPTAGDLSSVFSGAAAVISCVGVIGGSDEEMEKGNGDVNVAAASQVHTRFVLRLVAGDALLVLMHDLRVT